MNEAWTYLTIEVETKPVVAREAKAIAEKVYNLTSTKLGMDVQTEEEPSLPIEEEEAYEPPVSESDHNERHENGSVAGRSVNSGSLLDRGEAALSSMDRVRAIEGVMAYNHVRDKVKAFLKPFAESGTPVGAEDIKAYFAKLRGDDQGDVKTDTIDGDSSGPAASDSRKEQDGY